MSTLNRCLFFLRRAPRGPGSFLVGDLGFLVTLLIRNAAPVVSRKRTLRLMASSGLLDSRSLLGEPESPPPIPLPGLVENRSKFHMPQFAFRHSALLLSSAFRICSVSQTLARLQRRRVILSKSACSSSPVPITVLADFSCTKCLSLRSDPPTLRRLPVSWAIEHADVLDDVLVQYIAWPQGARRCTGPSLARNRRYFLYTCFSL